MQSETEKKPKRLIRRRVVESMTGLGRTQIYDLMKARRFPAAVPLGPRAVGWLESEVQGWIDERLKERDEPTALRSNGIRRPRNAQVA